MLSSNRNIISQTFKRSKSYDYFKEERSNGYWSNERVAEEVRKKTREVNDKYCNYKYQVHDTEKTEINELMHDTDYQKIFYGCNISFSIKWLKI